LRAVGLARKVFEDGFDVNEKDPPPRRTASPTCLQRTCKRQE
jgi:hypothetical protein